MPGFQSTHVPRGTQIQQVNTDILLIILQKKRETKEERGTNNTYHFSAFWHSMEEGQIKQQKTSTTKPINLKI